MLHKEEKKWVMLLHDATTNENETREATRVTAVDMSVIIWLNFNLYIDQVIILIPGWWTAPAGLEALRS